MADYSLNKAIIELSEEIMMDAELQRGTVKSLVLKASRLARLCDDMEVFEWLGYERSVYYLGEPVAEKYLNLTSRWIDREKNEAYWGGVGDHEATIEAYEHQMQVIKAFVPSGEYALLQFDHQTQKVTALNNLIMNHKRIVIAVQAHVQNFAARTYKARVFSSNASDIFSTYQSEVDSILREKAGNVLSKIPHIFERIKSSDPESISHALTTCRRVIEALSEVVYPPQKEPVLLGDQAVDVTERHCKNRLRVFIKENSNSSSRYERMNKAITSLYDRVSAGVHSDVDAGEAKALTLQTYLTVGEVLSLVKK